MQDMRTYQDVPKPKRAKMRYPSGVYETEYGNAAVYEGGSTAYDLDMGESIPIEMVDFTKRIGEIEDYC